jgi:aldehyde dehydrogenase (NAD+)
MSTLMRRYLQFYIDGAWVDPVTAKTLDVTNPATASVAGVISVGSAVDVDRAVQAASRAFGSWSRITREQRLAVLDRIIEQFSKRVPELGDAIMEEMGAPKWLAHGTQAAIGVNHFKTARKILETYKFEEDRGTSRVIQEPIGVCGFITPWNWPIHQICAKVAPALATGCTVVLKPSEIAPFSAVIFAEIMHAAGVPAGVFNLVQGEGPVVGLALAEHPLVDMV